MLGLAAAATPITSSMAATPGTGGKKNMILILTDQQRTTQWFPEGWEQENLPAMTYLKSTGITFTQSVNNTCACTPSRTTIFTGKYPTTNFSNQTLTEFFQPDNATATPFESPEDNDTNGPTAGPYPAPLSYSEVQLDQTIPNLATVLADAGYDTFYKGKFHLGKGVLGYDNYLYEPDPSRYGFLAWDAPDAGQDAQKQNYGGGTADNDGRFTKDAVAFLKDRVANADKYTRPFCLVFSLVNPHDVLGYPNNWVNLVDNGGYSAEDLKGSIRIPPTINENLRTNYKPSSQQNWLTVMGSLEGAQQRNYLNFYGNLLKLVDSQIMKLLNVLRAPSGRDVLNETMIVRTSDHGEMGMTHGGMRQKWFNIYEETIKVPLVWSNPVLFPKPVTSDALVSLVDLLPTMASFCGIKNLKPYGFQGVDYSSLFTNPTGSVQDYTYFINTDVRAGQKVAEAALPPNNIAAVRNAQYKYARYYGGITPDGSTSKEIQEEFYNLANDVDPATGESVELHNKSAWAVAKGAPWTIEPYEEKKRTELQILLRKATGAGGVLALSDRVIPPMPMKPRAKVVVNAWGAYVVPTAQAYQVICYSQYTYKYTLQYYTGSAWADTASTTTLVPTTLDGNNGPILFQAQPTQSKPPHYRVARTAPNGEVTYGNVVWEDYTVS